MTARVPQVFVLLAVAAIATTAEANESPIAVEPIACERGPWTSASWRTAIETELAAAHFVLASGATADAWTASGAREPRTQSALTVKPHDCEDPEVGATLHFAPGGAAPASERRVPLRTVDPAARQRALALAAIELVRSETEAIALADTPVNPQPERTAPKPASPVRPAPERPAWRRELAQWSIEGSGGGTAMLPEFYPRFHVGIFRDFASFLALGVQGIRRTGSSSSFFQPSLWAFAIVPRLIATPIEGTWRLSIWLDGRAGLAWGPIRSSQPPSAQASEPTLARSSSGTGSDLFLGAAAGVAVGGRTVQGFFESGYELSLQKADDTTPTSGPHFALGFRVRPFE